MIPVLGDALRRRVDDPAAMVVQLASDGSKTSWSYAEILARAAGLADELRRSAETSTAIEAPMSVALVCSNSVEFVVADLAALIADVCTVPVPLGFSPEQAGGLLASADVWWTDDTGAVRLAEWVASGELDVNRPAHAVDLSGPVTAKPALWGRSEDGVCKIIHTSGTTSRPKGVRIRSHGLDALLRSLHSEMPAESFARYLSLVPFSLLIEQVTGIYMSILHGGTIHLLPPEVPLVGTSAEASDAVMPFLPRARPTAIVATPALVERMERFSEGRDGDSLDALFGTTSSPLICVGGAPIQPTVLQRLADNGIDVFEGYGLSENSSVVSWNRPGQTRFGTVGRPLPHVEVKVDDAGELLVRSSSLFAGYTREDPSSCAIDADGWLHTGDLAVFEDDYIRITGRIKNVIITSSGRNIAPEWVEAKYRELAVVQAAAVVGDGREAVAGLFILAEGVSATDGTRHIARFGESNLSNVERVSRACVLSHSDVNYLRYFTVTGRPVRTEIERAFSSGALELRDVSGTAETYDTREYSS